MRNHTGAVVVCQLPDVSIHVERAKKAPPVVTPRDNKTGDDTDDQIDWRLARRYGNQLLTGGYTALPTYAWVYYARLGVTEAEMVCIAQLCTYWWTERDPYPGEAALAARMGKTVRTIQGYLRSLEGKGLLHIQTQFSTNGQQHTNAYDLRPFFTAVEGLARLDGLLPATTDDTTQAAPAVPGSSPRDDHGHGPHTRPMGDTAACKRVTGVQNSDARAGAERESLCAGARSCGTDTRPTHTSTATSGEGDGSRAGGAKNPSPQVNPVEIETFDSDSMPPTPTYPANACFRKPSGTDAGAEGPSLRGEVPQDADGQALTAEIAALSDELGDDAPRSSLGRARNLRRDAGVPLDLFLALLDEAAARTRTRQASIVKRRRDGQAPNGMPYLFAVLQDLVHPAPPRTRDGGSSADRPRSDHPSRRRRRRDDGRGEAVTSYAAWSDSPAPLPIVEEHPVWRAVLDELAQVMTPENFNAWLVTTRALDQEGDLLRVGVPAPFNRDWLACKLAGKVMAALHKIDYDALHTAPVARVAYVVEAAA